MTFAARGIILVGVREPHEPEHWFVVFVCMSFISFVVCLVFAACLYVLVRLFVCVAHEPERELLRPPVAAAYIYIYIYTYTYTYIHIYIYIYTYIHIYI